MWVKRRSWKRIVKWPSPPSNPHHERMVGGTEMKIDYYSKYFWMWILPQIGLISGYDKYQSAFVWLFWVFHYGKANDKKYCNGFITAYSKKEDK